MRISQWLERRAERIALLLLGVLAGTLIGLATSSGAARIVTVSGAWRPPPGGYGSLQPVGNYAALPDDATAAAEVHASSWENRPDNSASNHTIPAHISLRPTLVRMRAYDPRWNRYVLARVSGHYAGTTDEIIQWAAAKWGLPDETLRAIAVMESDWHQTRQGDYVTDPRRCLPGYAAPDCPLSFGIAGVRSNSWRGSFPAIRDSTAANLDVLGGWLRGCYEGWVWWLRDHGNTSRGRYGAGDLWGCVGAWFSGNWHDGSVGGGGAEDYISRARHWYVTKPWLRAGY
jgi:autotransporter family porin